MSTYLFYMFVNIYFQWFLLRYDKCYMYYKNKCLQLNTTRNSKLLLKLYLNGQKTADTRFNTVIPSLFSIAENIGGENTT